MPKCIRTFLKTRWQVHTDIKCGGDYIYLGVVSNGIFRVFASNYHLQMDSNTKDLVVNVHVVPFYNSPCTQICPIICKSVNYPPFIVSLFCGSKK